jgi:serine/threonine-protein kinase
VLLVVVSMATALSSLFQWMELLVVRSGGRPLCSINDSVNCEAVWNSALASRIHHFLGIPVAGLGMVWALTAFGLSALLIYRLVAGAALGPVVAALRLTAAAGILACLTFAVGSARTGALCLTCLATYALVVAFALVVVKLLPGRLQPAKGELRFAVLWSTGLALASYLMLLMPGMNTPQANAATAGMERVSRATTQGTSESDRALESYLKDLSAPEKQLVSDSIAIFRRSPKSLTDRFRVRNRRGPENAPVKLVEFTDIRCSHCAELVQMMKQLEQLVPPGRFSVEARHFPLDGTCNPAIAFAQPNGVSCLGAKVQICLEAAPDFWQLREKLFAEQANLTPERILAIGSSGWTSREALEKCVASPETEAKLKDDLSYALEYKPRGTPLLVINGREGTAFGSFLFAMIMTNANPNSPAFASLPPPRQAQ